MPHRSVVVGGTIYFKFPTQTLAGVKATLSGTPAISAYKSNSTTQSTAGITLTVDFDGVTGLNHVTVDTSADGTFYASGSVIDLVITTGTVDSISVIGEVVASFVVEAAPLTTLGSVAPANWLDAAALAADAVAEIQSGLATAAVLTTVAGYLDTEIAAILEDTGTTLPAQIAALDVGGGTGARARTVTITDGAVPLENVNVRATQGIESYVQTTNASGVASFGLDDATWTVRATKAGYTLAAQSMIVSADGNATYAMTAVALSQPANPALVSHNVLCTGIDGEPEAGAIVYYRATAGTGTAGYSRDSGEATATADASGLATLTFITGVTYAIRRGTIGREVTYVASATTPPETLGAP